MEKYQIEEVRGFVETLPIVEGLEGRISDTSIETILLWNSSYLTTTTPYNFLFSDSTKNQEIKFYGG
jgi:hypothetical protein